MHILLTCATAVEAKPLRELLSGDCAARRYNNLWIWEGRRNSICMLRTGISAQRAKGALQSFHRPSSPTKPVFQREPDVAGDVGDSAKHEANKLNPRVVLVFGIAGQLAPQFPVGTIAIPELWRSELHATPLFCSQRLLQSASRTALRALCGSGTEVHVGGSGVTLQQPAWSRVERDLVRQRYSDAVICDMETFVVMEQFPEAECLSVRIISDDGSEPPLPSKAMKHPMCALDDVSRCCTRLAQFVYRLLQKLDERGAP
ncbi:MAG TPA: hypothetical protein VGL91_04985 [Acidobacteriota bacterium]